MKIRNGFVSNSSSSSFVISCSKLSDTEKYFLLSYGENEEANDDWHIYENDKNEIVGFTIMDNGALEEFLGESLFSKLNVVED